MFVEDAASLKDCIPSKAVLKGPQLMMKQAQARDQQTEINASGGMPLTAIILLKVIYQIAGVIQQSKRLVIINIELIRGHHPWPNRDDYISASHLTLMRRSNCSL